MKVDLPNIKKLFIPDPGYTVFDCDLAGADAQVVAWEAEDEELKAGFRAGIDIHGMNAEAMWGSSYTSLPGNPKDSSTPKGKKRKDIKQGVHLTNYGGSARTCAIVLGWTVLEAEAFQKRWFSIHPGIKTWHRRTEISLQTTRKVVNAFGFHRIYFDRIDGILPQALAWVPQSTIAITCRRGGIKIRKTLPWVQMLLQVHDSLVFQVKHENEDRIPELREALSNPIPYADPLTIRWDISRSRVSCGDVEKVK